MLLTELTTIVLFVYGILILGLYFGWILLSDVKWKVGQPKAVSIIIAYKDEADQIDQLAACLEALHKPGSKLEIILCNDHSQDDGPARWQQIASQSKLSYRLLHAPARQAGKKSALLQGASQASGDILLFTDADCTFEPGWVNQMIRPFSEENIALVQGPVRQKRGSTFLNRLEQVEYLSLMMTAAGSIGLGSGLVASGANLAVRKKLYLEAAAHLKADIPSGDDMFLMEYAKKKGRRNIHFCMHQEAVVSTEPSQDFKDFWNRRKRWGSKNLKYTDPAIIGSAMLVFITNLLIVLTLLSALVYPLQFWWFLISIVMKTFFELPLMTRGFRFYRIAGGTGWFLLTQTIYPIYVVTTAVAALTQSYTWKNRRRKSL